MAVAVYIHPKGMTLAQYHEVHKRLEAAGVGLRNQEGRLHHCCFGEDGALMIFDVWESAEAFEAFGQKMVPIVTELGIDVGQPAVLPVHLLDQEAIEGKV
ncbi:MAG TPA: hypothetical protein VE990_04945 [Acidimicrobiales bacterium]|nr:hypothetical protein [Acidimicrobiales bacterium]